MASAAGVRSHARTIAYLQETTRLRIERLITKLSPADLMGNPKTVARALGESINNALLGEIGDAMVEARKWVKYIGLDAPTLAQSRAIVREAVAEWRAAMEKRAARALLELQKTIKRDMKRGMSESAIKKALKREALRKKFYGQLMGPIKPFGPAIINEISARIRDAALGEAGRMAWITMEDKHVCTDSFETACMERHGEELTVKQWREVGLPGASVLLCSSFGRAQCRCELIAADSKEADLLDRVDVSAAIAEGREEARRDFGI